MTWTDIFIIVFGLVCGMVAIAWIEGVARDIRKRLK